MWWEVICVIPVLGVVYKLVKRLFYGGSGLPSSSDANSILSISVRYCLESNFAGEVKALAVGLQVPDVDLLLQFPREAMLISVKNDISGVVTIDKHGKWICTTEHQTIRIPDPVVEAQQQISILESYLQQRGLDLPPGYISCKVMCLNPNFRPVNPGSFPSEVVTREEFDKLKSESKSTVLDWICAKENMKEPLHEKLDLVLKTARKWDRLMLKGGQFILGEFLEFKGKQDDIQALQNLRGSEVFCLIFPETNILGLVVDLANNHFNHMTTRMRMGSYLVAMVKSLLFFTMRWMRTLFKSSPSNLTILYNEGNQVTVSSNTEIVFQARHSTVVRKYKLSSVHSMTLGL